MNIASAKRASEFVNIQKMDKRGRVTVALVPGHKGAWYKVIVSRKSIKGSQIMATKCECITDKAPCKGNSNKLCYHSLAAIMASANKTKTKVSFCNTQKSASKLTNMGGSIFVVKSAQSDKEAWVVVEDQTEIFLPC